MVAPRPRCQRARLKDAAWRTIFSEKKMQRDFVEMLGAKRRMREAEAELSGLRENLEEDEAGWAERVVPVVDGELGPD